jgi:hypothetical protein
MFTNGLIGEGPRVARRWLPEVEVVCLILLVVVAYFFRAGALPIRGEEPTRAQIAREMVDGRDYLVRAATGRAFPHAAAAAELAYRPELCELGNLE